MQSVNLNMIPGGVMPVINLSQFDEGRQFALAIYDGANAADLSTATIEISGRKNDDTAFAYSQSDTVKGNYVITVNNNVVTIRNTMQMAVLAGVVTAVLTIRKSASDVSTLNFYLNVQEHPLDGVDVSETEIPAIIALAQAQADEAEAWATGEIDGVPVPSDAPQYQNSAEYWAGISEQYAQGGLKWKGDCTFAQIPTSGMAVGDMWNITDAFTTDARFKEGAGISVKAGTNIAWDGTYWDLLSTGAPVALPTGGIAGQVIVKRSSTDGDAGWGQGIYCFPTIAAAQAAISAGTLPNGATAMVDEIGGNGTAPALANMADVNLVSLQNGQILRYNSVSGKWENKAVDSVISTGSTNPVQNSSIAAALANGRITFGVDANGHFGYKKDGADTIYQFAPDVEASPVTLEYSSIGYFSLSGTMVGTNIYKNGDFVEGTLGLKCGDNLAGSNVAYLDFSGLPAPLAGDYVEAPIYDFSNITLWGFFEYYGVQGSYQRFKIRVNNDQRYVTGSTYFMHLRYRYK